MKTFANVAVAVALLAACFALPAWGQQSAAERADLARYQRYAEAPVDHVRYFQIDGFQYLGPDKLAIWFGVNKLYLLTVQTPCINLEFANGIGLTARDGVLYRNFDFVSFGHQQCRILKIVPVDELKMKQDARKAASGSSGRQPGL